MKSKKTDILRFRLMPYFLMGLMLVFLSSCSRQPVYSNPHVIGSEVVVDISNLEQKKPLFFSYPYRGKNVNFFVIKIDDKILSFLDSCEQCYPQKKGYRFEKDSVICRACNVGYNINEIEKGFGSCTPIRIDGSMKDGKYVIHVSALEKMSVKF